MAIKYIVIHHTAVSHKVNPDQFINTNDYHKQLFNMKSSLGFWVGYNYTISASGNVRQTRVDGEETAAQIGHNFDSISICLDGNFDIEFPTDAQVNALTELIKEKARIYGVRSENIVPHRRFANKSCYGKNLSDTWASNLIGLSTPSTSCVEKDRVIIEQKDTLKKLTDWIAKQFKVS